MVHAFGPLYCYTRLSADQTSDFYKEDYTASSSEYQLMTSSHATHSAKAKRVRVGQGQATTAVDGTCTAIMHGIGGCPFEHPEAVRPTSSATYSLEKVQKGTAKYDEIVTELESSAQFVSSDGSVGKPRVVGVHRIINACLEALYEQRRGFLHDKHGFAMEKELWHGTSCKALPELLRHGLQPPSDTCPAASCPVSGGKGLCTTLCGTCCVHCKDPHA